MKEVIRIGEQQSDLPVEFTHIFAENGYREATTRPSEYRKVIYLGKCSSDGDVFAAYGKSTIDVFKGNLNSGKY